MESTLLGSASTFGRMGWGMVGGRPRSHKPHMTTFTSHFKMVHILHELDARFTRLTSSCFETICFFFSLSMSGEMRLLQPGYVKGRECVF